MSDLYQWNPDPDIPAWVKAAAADAIDYRGMVSVEPVGTLTVRTDSTFAFDSSSTLRPGKYLIVEVHDER